MDLGHREASRPCHVADERGLALFDRIERILREDASVGIQEEDLIRTRQARPVICGRVDDSDTGRAHWRVEANPHVILIDVGTAG